MSRSRRKVVRRKINPIDSHTLLSRGVFIANIGNLNSLVKSIMAREKHRQIDHLTVIHYESNLEDFVEFRSGCKLVVH